MPANRSSRRRSAAIVLVIGALVGLTGALVNADWAIGAAFAVLAIVAAIVALRPPG
jgi:hypothetical protein